MLLLLLLIYFPTLFFFFLSFLRLVTGISRLDDQIFINRNPGVPSVVKFHPFNTCIAVADKDSIWWERLRPRHTRQNPANTTFITTIYLLLLYCFVFFPHSFWDWEKGERLDYFYNGNPRYTRITAMEYLNGHDCSLLLTATGQTRRDNILR